MAGALAEQQPAQRHTLTGRTQSGRLQHFVDIVPGTAGQGRLASRTASHGAGIVGIHARIVVAHVHWWHRTRYLSTMVVEYKKEMR